MAEGAPCALGSVVGPLPVRLPQELAEPAEALWRHQVLHFPERRECSILGVCAPAFVASLRLRQRAALTVFRTPAHTTPAGSVGRRRPGPRAARRPAG